MAIDERPSILEVVGQRVELRRAGRQYHGLCPFHSEKTPSFTVNADRGVFYCHGCHVGGDVIRFVELIEQTDFKGAVKILGIDGGEYKPKPIDIRKRRAAVVVATWMNQQHLKIGVMLRELTRAIVIAEDAGMILLERLQRGFSLLEIVFEDSARPEFAAQFLELKETIEALTARAQVEVLEDFPPLTQEYRVYLQELVA